MAKQDPAVISAYQAGMTGRLEEGIATLRRILQRQPGNLDARQALGQLLLNAGQIDQAVYQFEWCAKASPGTPSYHNNLGMALWHAGKSKEAVPPFREAVRLDPNYAIGWVGLSLGLANILDPDGAIEAADRAIALNPDLGEPYHNLGLALCLAGKLEEAIDAMRRGVAVAPHLVPLHSTLLMTLYYRAVPPDEILREAREFARLHPGAPGVRPALTDPDPDRRIRIGYVSADFRNHSVGYFAESMLEHRDRARSEVFCYFTAMVGDAVTDRFKRHADRWVPAATMDDAALDRRIRADKIDLLVEMAGHTPNHRLTALVNKPAPVIVSAIGYPGTTGLPAVDYRLVDSLTDPPGAEAHVTERLRRIDPCFLCYRPHADAPEVSVPAGTAGTGPIMFGSFNALPKVSPEVIATWARVLERVPGSGLLLKSTAFTAESTRRHIAGQFAAAGADPSRIELLPPNDSQGGHLATYARVDIALDTFPYNGTTTTCEALWMGVPVVGLQGTVHAGRVGVSLLSAVGLEELLARDVDEYVAIAARLAADRARLAEYRRTLRERMARSVLCDAAGYGRRVDEAFRGMWRAWCASRA